MTQQSISFPAIPVEQPIGTFFVGVMDAKDLVNVSVADVRRLHGNEIDEYIGIQRRLDPARSKSIRKYVKESPDATFPTAIILAVNAENADWDEGTGMLTLKESEGTSIYDVARIIDGQHRVDGLTSTQGRGFQVTVSIFIGADIATQANIFATVNLAQTKVNRSLVYDLLDYEKKKSPQKSAHHITVALDKISQSALHQRIKRLGSATPNREKETLTQAAVVESLLDLMTPDPMTDRTSFLRSILPSKPSQSEHERFPFRYMFLTEQDTQITKILLNFFEAVAERWPTSWNDLDRKGNVLPKTNGLKALMRYLRVLYPILAADRWDYLPEVEEFASYLAVVDLDDADFNIETFPPGTSGESRLFKLLMDSLEQFEDKPPILI